MSDRSLFSEADLFLQNDLVDTAFVFTCLCFAVPIIPAVGLGYSGYSTHKNGLASFYPAIIAMAVCTVQWWTIGYSLAYGSGGNRFFGGWDNLLHHGVGAAPIGTIPGILFSAFQLAFQATVCAIAVGGACERGRLLPMVPFTFLWGTLVYCPIAHMVWAEGGFLAELGALDFAGGTPVHICSGASATAIAVYLSRPLFRSRAAADKTPSHLQLHRPHNTYSQLLALAGIWTGWLAFEAGTALSLNYKAIYSVFTTHLAASTGCMTWALLDYRITKKFSLDSSFLGAIAGLVFITPAAGFVGMGSACFMSIVSVLVCRTALQLKSTKLARRLRWVDNGDSFATHCVGGFCATLSTGLFASREVAAYDGVTDIAGGVIFDAHFRQLGIQVVEALVGFTWAFVGSYVIIAGLDCIPGLEVLATDGEVMDGMDRSQMGESLHAEQWEDEVDYSPFAKRVLLQ